MSFVKVDNLFLKGESGSFKKKNMLYCGINLSFLSYKSNFRSGIFSCSIHFFPVSKK